MNQICRSINNHVIRPKIINTVIFDLYDTIIYPKKKYISAPLQAFIDTFANLGYKDDSENFTRLINKHMGKSKIEHLKSIINDPYMENFNNKNHNEIYKLFIKNQCVILGNPNYVRLDPLFLETVEILKNQGVKNFGATTGFNLEMTNILLKEASHQGLKLDMIITSDDVKHSRPHQEGINKILKKFNTKPDNCIKVGDTVMDIFEAKNAKVYSVGITTHLKPRDFIVVGSDYIINNIRQLPYVISKIECDL